MVLDKVPLVHHRKLSSVLSAASRCHVCYLKLYSKGDHREIEKTVENVCCHVLLLSTSTLESRDEIPVRGVEL